MSDYLTVRRAAHIGVFLQPELEYKPMPDGPVLVEMDAYYIKAIEQGDLELVEPELPAAPAPFARYAPPADPVA